MAQSLAGTDSVHHSVSDVSPRLPMRSDGAQLFLRILSPKTEPWSPGAGIDEAEQREAQRGEEERGTEDSECQRSALKLRLR